MAPLIAPGICRFAVIQLMEAREIVNVLDMDIDVGGTTFSRAEGCEEVAGDILNNWDDHILPSKCDELSHREVRWVDLDSATGSTGSISSTPESTWPKPGGNTTNSPFPGNVSLLVTKQAPGGGRSSRNGRWYMAGYPESFTSATVANTVDSTIIASLNTALDSFRTGITDAGDPGNPARKPVVVHTVNEGTVANPDIVFVGASDITDFTAQALLATQRRRLRG